MRSFEELCNIFEQCEQENYSMFVHRSIWDKKYSITLEKSTDGSEVKVNGKGLSIKEAFNKAINNFPKEPVSGGIWDHPPLLEPPVSPPPPTLPSEVEGIHDDDAPPF